MAEFDAAQDADAEGYHAELVDSIVVGHEIVGDLAGGTEFFSVATTEPGGHWVGQVDFFVTYGLTEDVQLDTGVNLGVSRAADDVGTYLGVSWRR